MRQISNDVRFLYRLQSFLDSRSDLSFHALAQAAGVQHQTVKMLYEQKREWWSVATQRKIERALLKLGAPPAPEELPHRSADPVSVPVRRPASPYAARVYILLAVALAFCIGWYVGSNPGYPLHCRIAASGNQLECHVSYVTRLFNQWKNPATPESSSAANSSSVSGSEASTVAQ